MLQAYLLLACEQALHKGTLAAGQEKEGQSWQLHISGNWISPSIPLWLPVDWVVRFLPISNVKKIEKHNISNVISANQHFTSTFLTQIFNFKRLSCKLSFLFLPCHQSAYAHRLIKGLFTWRWGTQVGEVTCCPYNLSFEFGHIYMISGVTCCGLLHLPGVPNLHVNRPLLMAENSIPHCKATNHCS